MWAMADPSTQPATQPTSQPVSVAPAGAQISPVVGTSTPATTAAVTNAPAVPATDTGLLGLGPAERIAIIVAVVGAVLILVLTDIYKSVKGWLKSLVKFLWRKLVDWFMSLRYRQLKKHLNNTTWIYDGGPPEMTYRKDGKVS